MGHHGEEVITPFDKKNYMVQEWVAANSMMNIINWSNWFVGTCENAEEALEWNHENGPKKVYYFKSFEVGSHETAAELAEMYADQGSETTAEGDGPNPGPLFYCYKMNP